jgi:hypothetical protein
MSIRTLLAATFAVTLVLAAAHGTAWPLVLQDTNAAQAAGAKAQRLSDSLARRVSLDKPFEGKFKDAIELLADKYELPIVLDPAIREVVGIGAECDGLEDKPVKLPKMLNVRVETLLRLTCEQADAMFLVYPDYLRVVPTLFGLYEAAVTTAGSDPNDSEPALLTTEQLLKTRPLTRRAIVNVSFKDAPIAEILDEIAGRSGANVALAPLVAEKANTKLTVHLANAPVDVAVRTICEMADLGMIEDANVLVVTTRERAAARMKQEAEKKKAAMLAALPPNAGLGGQGLPTGFIGGIGGGLGGIGGFAGDAAGADLGAEIGKLKDQNEQLRKQLDEVLKNLKK